VTDVGRLLGCVRDRLLTPATCGVPHVDRLVVDALRPGKLLRPDLVVRSAAAAAAGRSVDAEAEHRIVMGALAVELLHVATLVHDDIIDEAALRRGRPSVVAAAGIGTAIVVGDLLLARGAGAAARSAGPAAVVWARALDDMAAGQLREEDLGADASVEAIAEYVALKTASLFRASAEIGALAVGAPPEVVEAHGRFGHHVGMALQHVDDLLDAIGDPRRMGKPVGLDVANAVPTTVALLGVADSLEDVTALVVAELASARSALAGRPDGDGLTSWAADGLRRALETGLDESGRRRAADLSEALGAAR
jgi:geranylgeranyl pyrophosphate synthase